MTKVTHHNYQVLACPYKLFFDGQLIQEGVIGNLETDNQGQLVIYTDMKIDQQTGKLRKMQESDF